MTTATLTSERADFVAAIRDFVDRESPKWDKNEANDVGVYQQLAELGWLGVSVPEEYGGSGGGMVDQCLLLEEIARGMIPVAGFGTTMIVAGAYERFGTEEQKERMLTGIAGGAIEAIAMSEPGAGSDVGAMRCKAVRENGHYVVNGHKTWISNAHLSKNVLLIARTDASGSKHEGLTMLEVPNTSEGIEIRGIDTMGGREVNDVFYTDTVVPAENVIGTEGQAWMQLMAGLNVERLIIAALSLGAAQRAFDDCLAYIKEREQFGRPIGSFQALKHRVADMAVELECARLLTYDVAQKVDAAPEKLLPREASMAKLKCTEVSKMISLEAMQMAGGYGYASEYPFERHVRGALVSTIYGGTSEIQREIVAKTYGL